MILSDSTWEAAGALAVALAGAERFNRYAEPLRIADGPVDADDRFMDSLLRVTTGGMGSWEGHLWMLGYWVADDPLWNLEATDRGKAFVADAVQVSNAAMLLFTWFRARLPTFPYTNLPQLAKGSSFTTREFSTTIRWIPAREMQPLHFVDFPAGIASALGADSRLARTLRHAAVALLKEFSEEGVVRAHRALRKALTADDISQLAACRRALTEELALIDNYESQYAIPRHQFRETTTHDALRILDGRASEFAESFNRLSKAINMCLATVVPTLAAFGSPTKIGPLSDISLDGTDDLNLEASVEATPSVPFVRVGRVYDARESGFEDPLFVTGHSMNFSAASGTLDTISGEMLQGGRCLLSQVSP